MERSVGILTSEQFHGGQNAASSRIRTKWLLKYWPEAELFKTGRRYEAVILQKAYWLQYAQQFTGIKILDLCDLDFLRCNSRIKELVDLCDAVTTSTIALATLLAGYTSKPVRVIPDRIDPDVLGEGRKDHTGAGPARIVAWYGYSHNFTALSSMVGAMIDLGIAELIVIANESAPFTLPAAQRAKLTVTNYSWSTETVCRDLLRADMVVNPRLDKGRWAVKSDNKTLMAWALGLPVAHTREELASLMSLDARVKESELRRAQAIGQHHVLQSVHEYRELLAAIRSKGLSEEPPAGAVPAESPKGFASGAS